MCIRDSRYVQNLHTLNSNWLTSLVWVYPLRGKSAKALFASFAWFRLTHKVGYLSWAVFILWISVFSFVLLCSVIVNYLCCLGNTRLYYTYKHIINKFNTAMACQNIQCSRKEDESIRMNESDIIDFLIAHGVIKEAINCPSCGSLLALNRETLYFRCRSLREVVAKKKKKRYDIKRSAREGSFLSKTHHHLTTYFYLVCYILHMPPSRQHRLLRNNNMLSLIHI